MRPMQNPREVRIPRKPYARHDTPSRGAAVKHSSIVIVGAGHAGVQAAASLREEGYSGKLTLISDEAALPYHRPPLSKAFLKGTDQTDAPLLRAQRYYDDKNIDLLLSESVAVIDREAKDLRLGSGRSLAYDHLILATGSRSRSVDLPGINLDGIFQLRNVVDARRIRRALRSASRLAVIGAGFIGLEIAATATELGIEVDVVELSGGPLSGRVSQGTAQFYCEAHRAYGARLHFNVAVSNFVGGDGSLRSIQLSDGKSLTADMAVLGIGVVPNDAIAQAARLVCNNGIAVDEYLRTSDCCISAIGDVANAQSCETNSAISVASVQNATDQARFVARRLMGREDKFRTIPLFWSDQRDLKLQIAGLARDCNEWIDFNFAGSRLSLGLNQLRMTAVETVNRPKDHLLARRLFETGKVVDANRIRQIKPNADGVLAELVP